MDGMVYITRIYSLTCSKDLIMFKGFKYVPTKDLIMFKAFKSLTYQFS